MSKRFFTLGGLLAAGALTIALPSMALASESKLQTVDPCGKTQPSEDTKVKYCPMVRETPSQYRQRSIDEIKGHPSFQAITKTPGDIKKLYNFWNWICWNISDISLGVRNPNELCLKEDLVYPGGRLSYLNLANPEYTPHRFECLRHVLRWATGDRKVLTVTTLGSLNDIFGLYVGNRESIIPGKLARMNIVCDIIGEDLINLLESLEKQKLGAKGQALSSSNSSS